MQFCPPHFTPQLNPASTSFPNLPNLTAASLVSVQHALETHRVVLLHDPGNLLSPSATASSSRPSLAHRLATCGWAAPYRAVCVLVGSDAAAVAAAERAVVVTRRLAPAHIGGEHAGYAVAAGARRSPHTRVVYFSPAAFLHAMRRCPFVPTLSVVIIPALHSRPPLLDLVLALLPRLLRLRPDLRLVLATAVDVAPLKTFCTEQFPPLNSAQLRVMRLSCGDSHEDKALSVFYARQPLQDYSSAVLSVVADLVTHWHRCEYPQQSNILVFVPTAADVSALRQALSEWAIRVVYPAFRLTVRQPNAQSVNRASRRPVLSVLTLSDFLATQNNPNTSSSSSVLHHPHFSIVLATDPPHTQFPNEYHFATVIDSGFATRAVHNARTGLTTRPVLPVSRADAHLRARCAAVRVVRLFTRDTFRALALRRATDLQRADLTGIIACAAAVGVGSTSTTDAARKIIFVAAPASRAFVAAQARLNALGALDESGALNENIGRPIASAAAELQLPPRAVRAVLAARDMGAGRTLAALVAMHAVRRQLFVRNGRASDALREPFAVAEGDLVTRLNVWRRWVAAGMADRWCRVHGIHIAAMRSAARLFQRLLYVVGDSDGEIASNYTQTHSKQKRFDAVRRALGLTDVQIVCKSVAAGYFENAAMAQPDGTFLVAVTGRRVCIDVGSVLYGRVPDWVVFDELVHAGPLWAMRDVTVIKAEWLDEVAPTVFRLSGR